MKSAAITADSLGNSIAAILLPRIKAVNVLAFLPQNLAALSDNAYEPAANNSRILRYQRGDFGERFAR